MASDFLEKTLEEIIFENTDKAIDRGLTELFYEHTERQYILPSKRIMDIFTWQIRGDVLYAKIFELKKGEISNSALWQGLAYMEELVHLTMESFTDIKLDLVLVGNGIEGSLSNLILIIPKNLRLYTYDYDWDGLRFKKHNYSIEELVSELQATVREGPAVWEGSTEFSNQLRLLDAEKIKSLEAVPNPQ